MFRAHTRRYGSCRTQLVCSDGTLLMLLPVFVLMAHNHKDRLLSAIGACGSDVGTAAPQLVCSDGPAPDVTTGLCADGSQPQGQAPPQLVCSDGTAPDVTTVFVLMAHNHRTGPHRFAVVLLMLSVLCSSQHKDRLSQLVCSDGAAPDVTTGLCADGSQPQAPAESQTDLATNVTGFSSSPTTQDTQEIERTIVPREEPIQPVTRGETCDPAAQTIKKLSSGPLVTRLQNLLAERGFNPGIR